MLPYLRDFISLLKGYLKLIYLRMVKITHTNNVANDNVLKRTRDRRTYSEKCLRGSRLTCSRF